MGRLTWIPILAVYVLLIADTVILKGLTMQGLLCSLERKRKGCAVDQFLLDFVPPLDYNRNAAFSGFVLGMMTPFLLLFLPTVICLAISYPMEQVFRKHMQPEDIEKLQKEHSL